MLDQGFAELSKTDYLSKKPKLFEKKTTKKLTLSSKPLGIHFFSFFLERWAISELATETPFF